MKKILLLFLLSFSKSFSQEPTIQWGGSIGGFAYDSAQAMNVDASGNLYLTGGFQATADFDIGTGTFSMNGVGQAAGYLIKYNNDGILQWGNKYAGNFNSFGFGVGFDNSGNVYSMGTFNATVDFDPGANVFNMSASTSPYVVSDIYLTKLNSNGNFVFAKAISGLGVKDPSGFAVDAAGNSYLTGYFNAVTNFSQTVSLTPTNGVNDMWVYDMFIAKYNNSGGLSWVKQIGNGSISQRPEAIVTDAAGNLYICGQFEKVTDFDPSPTATFTLTPHTIGSSEIFVLKLDNSGNFLWAKNMGGASMNTATALALDATGNLYLTGYFSGTIDFDGGPNEHLLTAPPTSGFNAFLLKLNSDGGFTWVKHLIGNSIGNAVKVNTNGKIAVAGTFYNTCDFSSGAGTAVKTTAGGSDAFVTELNPDGTFNWVKSFGGNQDDEGKDVTSDAAGNYFIFGEFKATASIENISLTSNGSTDIFILKTDYSLGSADFNAESFSIFPNPSQNELHINVPQSYANGEILIYSINGQLVKKSAMTDVLNIEVLATGSYVVKITNNANEFIERLLIKK